MSVPFSPPCRKPKTNPARKTPTSGWKTFKANVKKFYEEDQRQLQAWEWCGKKSRKGKKVLDLEAFLTAASDYIEARTEVVKTAREEAARITGQPLPQEKKKPGEGDEPAGPPPAKPAKKE